MIRFLPLLSLPLFMACNHFSAHTNAKGEDSSQTNSIGTIERYDAGLDDIISVHAKVEIIADDLDWSEGPLWVEDQKMLLYSDVPQNTVYKWTEEKGNEIYLKPSGFSGTDASAFREPGSNGLLLDPEGHLVLCQQGFRRIGRMDAPLDHPSPTFTSIADQYEGKKFSSPNDCIVSSTGEYYLTDPPYGLKKMDDDPLKETAWNGVYKVKKEGTVILLTDSVTKPNGIALFPGEKKLLVANSDPKKPYWYVWDVEGDALTNGKIFYSAAGADPTWKGLPDGLKIDNKGNVIASGPGGVYFFNSNGKKLGMIRLQNPASNIALTPDNSSMFITNDMYVLRVKMKE